MTHTTKILIRLGGCPGWSEFSLGTQVILMVLLCTGLFIVAPAADWFVCASMNIHHSSPLEVKSAVTLKIKFITQQKRPRGWAVSAPDFGSRVLIGVAGSNPAGGKILPEPKGRFIAQSLSCSPFHRLEMTEILLKGRKTLTHPSIMTHKPVELRCSYLSHVKRICVFEHSGMTNFNCACPAIQRGQGSGFLSEGFSWFTACMSEQRRFWRDCADAQARLNLRCSHRR